MELKWLAIGALMILAAFLLLGDHEFFQVEEKACIEPILMSNVSGDLYAYACQDVDGNRTVAYLGDHDFTCPDAGHILSRTKYTYHAEIDVVDE